MPSTCHTNRSRGGDARVQGEPLDYLLGDPSNDDCTDTANWVHKKETLILGNSHMSHSLNSLKGGYIGDYIGDYYRGY